MSSMWVPKVVQIWFALHKIRRGSALLVSRLFPSVFELVDASIPPLFLKLGLSWAAPMALCFLFPMKSFGFIVSTDAKSPAMAVQGDVVFVRD